MKYGILGDIHANLEALEAVLAAMEKHKPDKLMCVGDVVGYGADPSACIAKIREIGATTVAGNHDFATIDKINVDFFNSYAREAALWTRRMLTKEEKGWLASLPLVELIDDCTLVHATLHSPELFEYIQTSYDAHLSFEQMTTHICFLGHSHVPVTFIQKRSVSFTMEPKINVDPNAKTIVNVGSVGQPRDENPDAAFAIYDEATHQMEIFRIPYDIEKAAGKIVKAGLPEILAERLRYGR